MRMWYACVSGQARESWPLDKISRASKTHAHSFIHSSCLDSILFLCGQSGRLERLAQWCQTNNGPKCRTWIKLWASTDRTLFLFFISWTQTNHAWTLTEKCDMMCNVNFTINRLAFQRNYSWKRYITSSCVLCLAVISLPVIGSSFSHSLLIVFPSFFVRLPSLQSSNRHNESFLHFLNFFLVFQHEGSRAVTKHWRHLRNLNWTFFFS